MTITKNHQDVSLYKVEFDNGMVFFTKHYHYENGNLVNIDYSKIDARSHISMQQAIHIYKDEQSVLRAIKRYEEMAKG
jgi:hypothetical protein